jgi:hypothetical protein
MLMAGRGERRGVRRQTTTCASRVSSLSRQDSSETASVLTRIKGTFCNDATGARMRFYAKGISEQVEQNASWTGEPVRSIENQEPRKQS